MIVGSNPSTAFIIGIYPNLYKSKARFFGLFLIFHSVKFG
ncbi:UDP-N-acetylglucosamine 1-carboxyvinyltransferase [Streptococcus suis]|nr:UDP-N-acetylglucosamine 1-carboxyvinyltransferase [Streptococcus suis]